MIQFAEPTSRDILTCFPVIMIFQFFKLTLIQLCNIFCHHLFDSYFSNYTILLNVHSGNFHFILSIFCFSMNARRRYTCMPSWKSSGVQASTFATVIDCNLANRLAIVSSYRLL